MKRINLLFLLLIVFLCFVGKSYAKEEWKEYKTHHFIIYYKDAPRDFIENIEEFAEKYYTEIAHNLGFTRYQNWTFDDRAKIYVYKNQDDYIKSAKQSSWSHGIAEIRKKIIRTFPSAHGFFDSTLPHELGHIIFREFVGYSSDIPLWMDEGIAMFQEKAKRWGAHEEVRKAMEEERFIPLMDLTKMKLTRKTKRETIELYYAQAASVVYYMIKELGEYKFVRFCRELKKGTKFERALESVYVRIHSIEDLNKLWVRYLQD